MMCLPPFTLNPKVKIPLYLRSPNKFWAWRWRCRSWYTSSLELSHVLARREPSRDRVPRASDVTGISRKLRGSSAEATGWVWEYLVTPSLPQTSYQVTASGLNRLQPAQLPLRIRYRVTVFGFNPLMPAPTLPFELVRVQGTPGFRTDIAPKRLEIPFAEEPPKHLRRKRPRKSPAEARRRKTYQ